jgi:hypothetical protein
MRQEKDKYSPVSSRSWAVVWCISMEIYILFGLADLVCQNDCKVLLALLLLK